MIILILSSAYCFIGALLFLVLYSRSLELGANTFFDDAESALIWPITICRIIVMIRNHKF